MFITGTDHPSGPSVILSLASWDQCYNFFAVQLMMYVPNQSSLIDVPKGLGTHHSFVKIQAHEVIFNIWIKI